MLCVEVAPSSRLHRLYFLRVRRGLAELEEMGTHNEKWVCPRVGAAIVGQFTRYLCSTPNSLQEKQLYDLTTVDIAIVVGIALTGGFQIWHHHREGPYGYKT